MTKHTPVQTSRHHDTSTTEAGTSRAGQHASPAALSLRSPGVQAKLTVNEPGDRFEQEANTVADKVMRSPVPSSESRLSAVGGVQRMQEEEEPSSVAEAQNPRAIQRQAAEEEPVQRQGEEEEPVQLQGEEEPVQRQGEEEEPVQRQAAEEEPVQRQGEEEEPVQLQGEEEEPVQRQGEGTPRVSPSTAATIRNPGAGQALSPGVRSRIEPHVGANLSGVRVHTGTQASAAASSLRAHAFTHSNNIFLNSKASPSNVRLMAHESAHVVQQGAAPVQRQPVLSAAAPQVQRLFDFSLDDIPGIDAAEIARRVPGYTLFTVIIGYNPLTSENVARNATNLLQGLMELVPFGADIFDALNEHGIIQAAFTWVKNELERLDLSLDRIERTLDEAWEDIELTGGIDYNLGVLRRHFGRLLDDVESFALSLVDHIIEMIKDAAIGVAEDLLAENKAWALIKKILHYDPLRGEEVEASTVEILEDFLMLIGKEQELEQMRARGTLQRTADWLDTQIGTFTALLGELRAIINAAWDAIQPENLPNLMTNLESLAAQVGGFLQRVWDFASTVAATVLEFIKDALLGWLSSFAHEVPGFHLITVILGRNPFTDERVPRTAENIIRGFITLLPGGNQTYQELQETGTIQQAAQRIEGAMADLGITWEFVTGLFMGIWESLSIDDLIDPVGAFQRIVNQFGEPISRLFAFVQVVVRELFTLILQLMNFPTDILNRIIANVMQAFNDIKRDPVGFFENMLKAVKQGFIGFFDNILQYLLTGVTDWLFGQFRKAGIEPPSEITLESVLGLVMQVLGITVDRLWEKLGEHIGQENVERIRGAIDRLTGMLAFVRDVQERGVAAIWEYIQGQISNLWDTVIEQAKSWIMERVINRVTAKLLSMLDPTGIMAVVNSFMAFFNAIQSAIEYFREMLAIIDRYVSTIASVARGEVEPGAEMLEQGLASSIPVAIGFFANQVGLGNLADKLEEIIGGVRAKVDEALDWLIENVIGLARSVLQRLSGAQGEADERTPEQKQADLARAVQAARALDPQMGRLRKFAALRRIKQEYGLTELEATPRTGKLIVNAAINPEFTFELEDPTGHSSTLANALDIARSSIENLRTEATEEQAQQAIRQAFASHEPDTRVTFEDAPSFRVYDGFNVYVGAYGSETLVGLVIPSGTAQFNRRVIESRGPQQVIHTATGREAVRANHDLLIQRYVWRAVNEVEAPQLRRQSERNQPFRELKADIQDGPGNTALAIAQHVMSGQRSRTSPFISTTKAEWANIENRQSEEEFNQNGVIKIDLLHIDPANIIDISTQPRATGWGLHERGQHQQAYHDALHTREVLIRKRIPGEAIEEFRPEG